MLRMCWYRQLSALFLASLGLLTAAPEANAQLISWSSPKNSSRAPARSLRVMPPSAMPYSNGSTGYSGTFSAFSRWNPFGARYQRSQSAYSNDSGNGWNGSYTTMCVRVCDGYYFPLSYHATRSQMYRDSKVCEASCDCETKLFYMPSSSSKVTHMTDLSGSSYGQLDTAFEYRRNLEPSCSCRPPPWSAAEQSRHAGYVREAEDMALAQAQKREQELDVLASRVLAAMNERQPSAPVNRQSLPPAVIAQEPTAKVKTVVVAENSQAATSLPSAINEAPAPAVHSLTPDFGLPATEPAGQVFSRPSTPAKGSVGKARIRGATRAASRPNKSTGRGLFQL